MALFLYVWGGPSIALACVWRSGQVGGRWDQTQV